MENASKALLIAGAILLCILIIAIGMFIYNSAQSTITDSLTTLSTQEIEAFNNQFMSYQGVQKGTNVKNLMGKLIANANTYADELDKIPMVYMYIDVGKNKYMQWAHMTPPSQIIQNYIDTCGRIRNTIETKKEYNLNFSYQKNGLIDCIKIVDVGDEEADAFHRLY